MGAICAYNKTHREAGRSPQCRDKNMNAQNKRLLALLPATLNQWREILRNEMKYSADLRNSEKVQQANMMIAKIENMIEDAKNA